MPQWLCVEEAPHLSASRYSVRGDLGKILEI